MQKKFKRIAALSLSLILILSLSVPALATAIMPRWVTTETCDAALEFSGTTALCGISILGSTGTNKIVAEVTLEERDSNGNYSTAKTWEETVYSDSYTLAGNCRNCTKGAFYRLTVSATVTNSNGKKDTVTNYATGTC